MKFDTKLLHAGHNPKEHQMSINVPIYPTTAFDYRLKLPRMLPVLLLPLLALPAHAWQHNWAPSAEEN